MNRTEILKNRISELGVEALLVTSEVNQHYVTGFEYSDGYALVTKNGVYLITDFRYIEAAKAQAAEGVVALMPPAGKSALSLIRSILDEQEIGSILVEEYTLSINDYKIIKKGIGKGIKYDTGASVILDSMRLYKTDEENKKQAYED